MKTTFLTFTYAIAMYAIITLPTIVIPTIYGYSMLLAIGFGLAAWIVYSLIFAALKSTDMIVQRKWLILILSIPLCVAIAYHLIGVLKIFDDVWNAEIFLLFPLAAVVAGWISLYKTRNEIEDVINPSAQNILIY